MNLPALPAPDARLPEGWRENRLYLYGIDLYHFGFLWESHEAWETLWQDLPRDAPQALFYRTLILISAAQIKLRDGRRRGVTSLSRRAWGLLQKVCAVYPETRFMGIDLSVLLNDLVRYYGPSWEKGLIGHVEGGPPRLILHT